MSADAPHPGPAGAAPRAHTERMSGLRVLLPAVLAAVALALAPASLASAADGGVRTTGHDVSFPQCGQPLPERGSIAVVGVNGGTGTTTNPCLAEQLAWADAGGLADVYVNTANPGHLGGWWPSADSTRTGLPVADPHGACRGAEDSACAYVYGWSIATDDVLRRGLPRAADRTWWLDVETVNSWSWGRSANTAVLEGMTDALHSAGAEVGLYSTADQLRLVAGRGTSSRLAGLPGWLAGGEDEEDAVARCSAAPLTPGGTVRMVQWVEGGRDHDVACPPAPTGTRPVVHGPATVGSRLDAVLGAWGPDGVRLDLQWLRDGASVDGATGPSYTTGPADAGASVSVRVTARRPGLPPLTLTSAGMLIAAAPAAAPVPVP